MVDDFVDGAVEMERRKQYQSTEAIPLHVQTKENRIDQGFFSRDLITMSQLWEYELKFVHVLPLVPGCLHVRTARHEYWRSFCPPNPAYDGPYSNSLVHAEDIAVHKFLHNLPDCVRLRLIGKRES